MGQVFAVDDDVGRRISGFARGQELEEQGSATVVAGGIGGMTFAAVSASNTANVRS